MAKVSIKSYLNAAVADTERKAEDIYTQTLRSHVSMYNWPENIVSQLSVTYGASGHQVTYPKSIEDQVLTLEYGTQTSQPSPAIRNFHFRMGA